MSTLITISFSHFCEKARWALDLVGEPYREEGHLPIFHLLPVWLATRGAKDKAADLASSANSTPVLITTSNTCICDSTRIVTHLLNGRTDFFIDGDALRLDAKFSKELGPHTRRYGYHFLFGDVALVRRFFWGVGTWFEAIAFLLTHPIVSWVIRKALRITNESAERSKKKVLAVVDDVEALLADGRRYLCGDKFGLADLSFAALMAPSIMLTHEEGYGSYLPSMEEAGGEVAAFAMHLRSRPAGQFALRIYRDHRSQSAAH